jgi:hypothetical protein
LAQIDFSQAPIVLATGTRALLSSFFVGTFIQNQQATVLQDGLGLNIGLNLAKDPCVRPGRIRHELLQPLTIPTHQSTVDIGIVPLVVHGQLPPHEHTLVHWYHGRGWRKTGDNHP